MKRKTIFGVIVTALLLSGLPATLLAQNGPGPGCCGSPKACVKIARGIPDPFQLEGVGSFDPTPFSFNSTPVSSPGGPSPVYRMDSRLAVNIQDHSTTGRPQ